jgi:hypothetical protein
VREAGYYWIKYGGDWVPASYEPELSGLKWWVDDYPVAESSIEQIAWRILNPDEISTPDNVLRIVMFSGQRKISGEIEIGEIEQENIDVVAMCSSKLWEELSSMA